MINNSSWHESCKLQAARFKPACAPSPKVLAGGDRQQAFIKNSAARVNILLVVTVCTCRKYSDFGKPQAREVAYSLLRQPISTFHILFRSTSTHRCLKL